MSPLYDFQCPFCGKKQEHFFHIDDCPEIIECDCGKKALKILSVGHGGIQTDNNVTWLPSAIKTLQPDYERPLQTRSQYKKYLKEKGLEPIG